MQKLIKREDDVIIIIPTDVAIFGIQFILLAVIVFKVVPRCKN